MEKWKLEKRVLDLVSAIFHYGDFKAETPNEKELESILIQLGKWPTNEDTCVHNSLWWQQEIDCDTETNRNNLIEDK